MARFATSAGALTAAAGSTCFHKRAIYGRVAASRRKTASNISDGSTAIDGAGQFGPSASGNTGCHCEK